MQTNCVEIPLDSVHVPLRLLGASLRCVVHTILMLRLPQNLSSHRSSRLPMERQPQKAPQPTHSFACNERLQTHAKKAAVSAAAVQLFFQDGVDNKNGDITVAVSSKRSSPSADRSSSSSSSSSSKKYNSQFHSQKWDYQQTSWLMESRETQEKMLQKDAPERHESQQGGGDLPQNHLPANTSSFSSSICIGSGRGSRGCACIGGLAEGTDPSSLRLQAHASAPLSLIYLRLSDAPQLSEEVEKKLRAFIGFVESDANSHRQQQKTEYNVSVVLYIQRPKAFGFLSSSVERVSFERWLLPVSICWCMHNCSSCCVSSSIEGATKGGLRNSTCCCRTTQCCQGGHMGGKLSCILATTATNEAATAGTAACGKQHALRLQPQLQQQQRQQQEHPFFADYLPKDVKQQQEVERALRHILFAVVEMATARQFHLPPPSVSHQLYGYDIIVSSNQAPPLGEWALQLPQAVRLF